MSILPSDYRRPIKPVVTTSTDGIPPVEVVDVIEAGIVNITRRAQIFESDGKTPWKPNGRPDIERLMDGSVTVNYSADERRVLDLTLDNQDMVLNQNPNGGFWYDKIIKIFRGVRYQGAAVVPRMVIIEAVSNQDAAALRRIISSFGFTKVDYKPDTVSMADLKDYTFVVVSSGVSATTRGNLLRQCWLAGKNVVSLGTGSGHSELPHYTDSVAVTDARWNIVPVATDTPTQGSFGAELAPNAASGRRPSATAPGVLSLALTDAPAGVPGITAALATSPSGAYWLDLHMPSLGLQSRNLFKAALNFMRGYNSVRIWETQLGEFMVDNISADNYPDVVKVTGRDYTKKMIQSKLSASATFVAGTDLLSLFKALAINSGIDPNKVNIGTSGEKTSSEMTFERGTDRWTIAKAAAEAYDYEIFFDAFGVFTVRKFIDPTTGPVSWTFKTGFEDDPSGANLVKYSKATSDSNIYNKVLVFSDPSDGEDRLPYFGEASNTDPNSPTRIARIGERVLPITTNWLDSDQACIELAKARLKIVSLESYNINWESIYYPWLECGTIITFLDPKRQSFEPTRYLMDSINFPLALGSMSATGKRITLVGSQGTPGDLPEEIQS